MIVSSVRMPLGISLGGMTKNELMSPLQEALIFYLSRRSGFSPELDRKAQNCALTFEKSYKISNTIGG